jgi:hypothetical protein
VFLELRRSSKGFICGQQPTSNTLGQFHNRWNQHDAFFSFCVVNAKRAASTKEATYALFVVLKYQPKISCLLRSVMYGG